MTTPSPKEAAANCPYCAALRRENAKHRLRHVAERDQMEADFRARECFLEAMVDHLQSELTALQRGIPARRRPSLVRKEQRA